MSNIIFQKVRFKNFVSYGNNWNEIDFTKKSDSILTGKNGHGKSVLLDLVIYALYGKPYRKVKKDELINRLNGKKLLVEIYFLVDDAQYKIIRGLKPNIFEIIKDDVMVEQTSTVRDYQLLLEQAIIGMTEITFRQTVILGSADYVPFMRMNKTDRRTIIEELLDILLFSVMNKITKIRIYDQKALYATVDNEISLLENSIEHINNHIESETGNREELLEENTQQINDCIATINDLTNSLPTEIETDAAVKNKSTLTKRMAKLKQYALDFSSKTKAAKKAITFYEDNDVCPTCNQELTEDTKHTHVHQEQDRVKKFNHAITEAKNTALIIQADMNTAIEIIDTGKLVDDDIIDIGRKIKFENKTKTALELQTQKILSQVSEDKPKELKTKKKELKTAILDRADVSSELNTLNAVVDLLKDDGVKSRIIKNYIPIFNKLIQKYMNLLEFQETFTVDDQFNDIIRKGRDIVPYMSHSEGEKRRLDLAMLFSMRDLASVKNANRTNLLIMDEILDGSLDQEGLDAFLKIKYSLIDEGQNLIVISHRQELADKFSGHIVVEKQGKFSEIIQN